jgi:hypothetical protein
MVINFLEKKSDKLENKIKKIKNDIKEICEETILDICEFLYEEDGCIDNNEFEESLKDLHEAIHGYFQIFPK